MLFFQGVFPNLNFNLQVHVNPYCRNLLRDRRWRRSHLFSCGEIVGWYYSENAWVCSKWQWNARDCVAGLHDRRSRQCNPVTPVECVSLLFRNTMQEWVMNIHYHTWIAKGRFINISRTPSKQWGVCDNNARTHGCVRNDSETHETVLLDCTTVEVGSAIQ